MPKGIFNPFAPKKQDFQASIGDNPLNTEFQEKPKGDVRLDGGERVISLADTSIEEIPARLGDLIADIAKEQEDGLGRLGICVGDTGPQNQYWAACAELAPEIVCLTTPSGTLRVCADSQTEDEAFCRLGHALTELPVKPILDRHKVQMIVRG